MTRTLRSALDMPGIYLYRDPVDFRKGFRGLAAIVEQELGHNPFDGGFYAFTNRRRNKIKCLYWEGLFASPNIDPCFRPAIKLRFITFFSIKSIYSVLLGVITPTKV